MIIQIDEKEEWGNVINALKLPEFIQTVWFVAEVWNRSQKPIYW